jgi:hypothetical protein
MKAFMRMSCRDLHRVGWGMRTEPLVNWWPMLGIARMRTEHDFAVELPGSQNNVIVRTDGTVALFSDVFRDL